MSLEYNFIYDIVLIAQITHTFTILKLCKNTIVTLVSILESKTQTKFKGFHWNQTP